MSKTDVSKELFDLIRELARPSTGTKRKASILDKIGAIAQYVETRLQVSEDCGLSYYLAALDLDERNVYACMHVLSLYKQRLDGHDDAVLARKCLRVLDEMYPEMDAVTRSHVDDLLRSIRELGQFQVDDLRSA